VLSTQTANQPAVRQWLPPCGLSTQCMQVQLCLQLLLLLLLLLLTCRSICGFQSLSYRMTMSAVARLIPRPPARVDSRNTNLKQQQHHHHHTEQHRQLNCAHAMKHQ
jgi:hypothetical protein